MEGNLVKGWTPDYREDSTLAKKLIVGGVDVAYEKLNKKIFLRKISLQLTLQDSSMRAFPLVSQDTLSLSQIREVRRKSPIDLRGDMPTTGARLVKPFAVIGVSVGLIISLFYLRSG